jgi:hypothetical protein
MQEWQNDIWIIRDAVVSKCGWVSGRQSQPTCLDGSDEVAQCLACLWLIWGGHAIKHAEQVSRGPSQQALAVRAKLLSHRPLPVVLHCLPGARRSAPCLTGHRRSGDLDDHEVRRAVEAQRHLKEPDLSGLDPVRADLRLAEPDLSWFPPVRQRGPIRSGSLLRFWMPCRERAVELAGEDLQAVTADPLRPPQVARRRRRPAPQQRH